MSLKIGTPPKKNSRKVSWDCKMDWQISLVYLLKSLRLPWFPLPNIWFPLPRFLLLNHLLSNVEAARANRHFSRLVLQGNRTNSLLCLQPSRSVNSWSNRGWRSVQQPRLGKSRQKGSRSGSKRVSKGITRFPHRNPPRKNSPYTPTRTLTGSWTTSPGKSSGW